MKKSLVHQLLSIWVLVSFLFSSVGAAPLRSPQVGHSLGYTYNSKTTLYRVNVHLRHTADQQRLLELTSYILQMDDDSALVMVDEDQLADLARLGFRPSQVTTLTELGLSQNALFYQDSRAILLYGPSPDTDGDGLTEQEEGFWCTDENDTDSDNDGFNDGTEAYGLQAYVNDPRSPRPSSGKPFSGWPPSHTGCDDSDQDAIPDSAEDWMGLNRNRESTDRDKFDDGQEVFGLTYCPGTGGYCSYGSLPRDGDWGIIFAEMPSWVLPPGNHPLAAAFPVPEVSVVPGSWTVERVTTITTAEGQMVETTNSYETSVTQGQSTSIADTVTWNEWEEVSQSIETPLEQMNINMSPEIDWGNFSFGSLKLAGGGLALGTAFVAGGACLAAGAFTLGVAAIPCAAALVGGTIGIIDGGIDIYNSFKADEVQQQIQPNSYGSFQYTNVTSSASANANVTLNQNYDFQGVVSSLEGLNYALGQQNQVLMQGFNQVSYAISQPRYTETHTNGRSWGGAQTTTHSVYEEHTITEGQAFTSGQNWSTAWAVDSSHAADLIFTYDVSNAGTEYAHEIAGLIFNIYLGDDTNPIISYDEAPDQANLYPGDSHVYTTDPIELTLEQMMRIDLGERLTIVLEDFSYGIDEAFYQDAIASGITVFVEDGVEDNDELVDNYVLPTWGTESVQDVLLRYFPAALDNEGNLNSLWTPEFDGTNLPDWNEHFLSEIAWWNIYLTQVDAGDTPLHELTAEPDSALLFRFNRDSDRDGYQDRVELKYYCSLPPEDPDSPYCDDAKERPEIHPQPEIVAGYVATREGNEVTVLLKIANFGNFDAYGIDAVMYAPDDTVTIGNNTVGGNGRVRPNSQVAVGSLILNPDVTNWDNSMADPYTVGNYNGDTDKVITFTVTTPGVVGSGSAAISWADGLGGSGTVDLGSNYHAPLPVEVTDGVQVGFDTGTVAIGDSFTVAALTPRDTFTYTIESEPYTAPVIVVSYSDPQGSHRFVTPVELTSLADDLTAHRGQMIPDISLSPVTTEVFDPINNNITHFVINSPHPTPIEEGHLYLNFVSDGELVAEVPYTMTIEPGPTVYPVSWSTDIFSDTYNPDGDNILIAFWTDAQDNIIDSAARPLNTFQEDALSEMAASATTWNFGTVTQGTLLQTDIPLANIGFTPLYAYASSNEALTAKPLAVNPATFQTLQLSLDTALLPTGSYNGVVTVRTSDINSSEITIPVNGTITALNDEALAHSVDEIRPFDQYVYVPGPQVQNEIVTFNHTISDIPQQTHPLYVYSQDKQNLLGVGEYGVDFSGTTATSGMFGTGVDGDLIVQTGQTVYANSLRSDIVTTALSGQRTIQTGSTSFAVGQEVLLIQMRGIGVGVYEFAKIATVNGSTIEVVSNLNNTYTIDDSSKAQIIHVPHYRNITVQNGGILTASSWDGLNGGIIAFRANGVVTIESGGLISANGIGYRGGDRGELGDPVSGHGWQGESFTQVGNQTTSPNNGGGGGGQGDDHSRNVGAGGGGGGYASGGANGQTAGDPPSQGGNGGTAYGDMNLTTSIYFGSGGGGGGSDDGDPCPGGYGGPGGGIILLFSKTLSLSSPISANGGNGQIGTPGCRTGGGGGGAGGSILIRSFDADIGSNFIQATEGSGASGTMTGGAGGNGGIGRIHIQYCNSLTGSTNPPSNTEQIDCFIIRQIPGNPNTELTLPEEVSAFVRYQVPYGQLEIFDVVGTQAYTLTLPKRLYDEFTLDLLFENLGNNSFTFSLDIGANGSNEWNGSGSAQPFILNSPEVSAGLNAYILSTSEAWGEEISIPINVTLDTTGDVFLTNLVATPGGDSDLQVGAGDLIVSNNNPNAGEVVNVNVTVHNLGHYTAENIIASFFAGNPEEDGVYLGSEFIPMLNADDSQTVAMVWDTTGYSGDLEVYVILDVAGQIPELDEENNSTSVTVIVTGDTVFLPIITKPQ